MRMLMKQFLGPVMTATLVIWLLGLAGVAMAYVGQSARTSRLSSDTGGSAEDSTYCVECSSVTELAGEKGGCGCATGGKASASYLGFAGLAGLALVTLRRTR